MSYPLSSPLQKILDDYNAHEHKDWITHYEKNIDLISEEVSAEKVEGFTIDCSKFGLHLFYVRVVNQKEMPVGVTLPKPYNNVLVYFPEHSWWQLRYTFKEGLLPE